MFGIAIPVISERSPNANSVLNENHCHGEEVPLELTGCFAEKVAGRRSFFRTAGIAGLGLLVSSPVLHASGGAGVHIPAEWVRMQGRTLREYWDYLGRLRLRNVPLEMLVASHSKQRGGVWNSLPPKKEWKYMAETLKVADRLAAEIRSPLVEIVSAYRSPQYNSRIAGASSGSYHQRNMALDLRYKASPRVVHQAARKLRAQGVFSGGVGRYGTFTHIDTRGENIDW